MNLRVGISSTFIEKAAHDGVKTIIESVKSHRGEVPFILSTREKGENPITDEILEELEKEGMSLIAVSMAKQRGLGGKDWRDRWGQEILGRLNPYFPVDLVFLFGDMTIWPENMCRELPGVNLHPDLPERFKGEWYNVTARIVESQSGEAGIMTHLVTPALDEGPVITYCSFSLCGPSLTTLWDSLPKDPQELEKLIREQKSLKEKPTHPLWQEIRRQGLAREFPLIEKTLATFAEGKIRIVKEGTEWKIIDGEGKELREGYDLTQEIETFVNHSKEGQFSPRKEMR